MASSSVSSPTVSFVWSKVFLLGGKIHECLDVDDPSCQGGIAALQAQLRRYTAGIDTISKPLLINRLDFETAFVQMHPLGRGVNRLVLHNYYGLDVYFAFRSLLTQRKDVSPNFAMDIANLNTLDIQPLFGNLGISTANPWNQFSKHIHFDKDSGLAVIVIDDAGVLQSMHHLMDSEESIEMQVALNPGKMSIFMSRVVLEILC